MTPDQILDEVRNNFSKGQQRRFLPGLLIALINTLRQLDAVNARFASLDEFYAVYPRRLKTAKGGAANTWTVWKDAAAQDTKGAKSLSIRPAYDAIARWIRADQRRFDYPSAAPHATQAWPDYLHWIEALLGFNDAQLDKLIADTKAFVLAELPSYGKSEAAVRREPPFFYLFLRDFDLSAKKGEPTGAAYQAAVFGYLRADAAHLQVDVGKVRTGSKRVGRIGDIDARDGELLVLAAEVKQFVIKAGHTSSFSELADQVERQGGLGLVAALDFEDGARDELRDLGLEPVSRQDLIDRVRLWDSLKQRNAIQALLYCVFYKEQNSPLYERIKAFITEIEKQHEGVPAEAVAAAIAADAAATAVEPAAAPVPAKKAKKS